MKGPDKVVEKRSPQLPSKIWMEEKLMDETLNKETLNETDYWNVDETHQKHLDLKPLFFEVPRAPTVDGQQEKFVGRKWLFREIYKHLTSGERTIDSLVQKKSYICFKFFKQIHQSTVEL